MARMQKMPMPKVPAGSIADKMKKMPLPVRPGPRNYKDVPKTPAPGGKRNPRQPYNPGGPRPKPLNGGKKLGPAGMISAMGKYLGQSNEKLQKAGPRGGSMSGNNLNGKRNEQMKKAPKRALGNKLQSMFQGGPAVSRKDTQKGGRPTLNRNKQAPNFKGVFQGLAKPKPRKTVPSRRGGR
jgi:hypothetical protein